MQSLTQAGQSIVWKIKKMGHWKRSCELILTSANVKKAKYRLIAVRKQHQQQKGEQKQFVSSLETWWDESMANDKTTTNMPPTNNEIPIWDSQEEICNHILSSNCSSLWCNFEFWQSVVRCIISPSLIKTGSVIRYCAWHTDSKWTLYSMMASS